MRPTDAMIAASSSGLIVRRSITSASMPSAASSSAASSDRVRAHPHATTVTSAPGRTTDALPSGTTWSVDSGTSPRVVQSRADSMKTTGSGDRIADFSNPFASAGFDG